MGIKGRKREDGTNVQSMPLDERRQMVTRMYLEGHVLYTIATITGMSKSTVAKDLDVVRKEWLEQRINNYDEKIAKEVAGLDYQESMLWEAWHNSCKQDIVIVVSQKKVLPREQKPSRSKRNKKDKANEDDTVPSDGLIVVEEHNKTTTRQLFGDPRFMAEITKVRELRCRLLGLLEDEPLQTPVVNIWQQLQDLATVRDNDPIEERLLMIEGKTATPPYERPTVDAALIPDPPLEPTPEQLLEQEKIRLQEDGIKKHLNLDWFDDYKDKPSDKQPNDKDHKDE